MNMNPLEQIYWNFRNRFHDVSEESELPVFFPTDPLQILMPDDSDTEKQSFDVVSNIYEDSDEKQCNKTLA